MKTCDVAIVGAGAAGLFCAGIAAQQGLSVVLIDHSAKLAEKIRISGGGRANFTNKDIDPRSPHKHFLGENPQFARSAFDARHGSVQCDEQSDCGGMHYHYGWAQI